MNPWKHDNLGLFIRFGIQPNSQIKRNTGKGQNAQKSTAILSCRGADFDCLLVLARVLFEHAVQVDGGLLEHLFLDVSVDVGGGLVVGVADDFQNCRTPMNILQISIAARH